MSVLADRYRWKALRSDDTEFSTGDDLAGAVMVLFMPSSAGIVPAHAFCDPKGRFVRRFIRQMKRAPIGGGSPPEPPPPTEHRLAARAARDAVNPRIARQPKPAPPKRPVVLDDAYHVLVHRQWRAYIRCWDGAVTMTPPDYELYT